ncbi:sensor histidine kinase [Psychromonas sp. KJ10-10]|uniref:sensor histidine kinase n=1 Tax=Psychromonas sp. KJ10-10 TaxID=3391823 RepID=UPI0039B38421
MAFLERSKLDKVSSNLARITHLTERMATISSQLKAFARKSDGVMSVISLQPVLLASYELVKPRLKASQVTLEFELPKNTILVKAEPIQLEQILVNLFSNAIQAMHESEIKNILVSLSTSEQNALVEVVDTGPGIEESVIGQLFEPFLRPKNQGLVWGYQYRNKLLIVCKGDFGLKTHSN